MTELILLSSVRIGAELEACAAEVWPSARVHLATKLAELDALSSECRCRSLLLSHSSSVIVPETILERFTLGAVNIHAASPEFPGRDPHHFAIYRGAKRYGATLHVMEGKVDAGPILATEMFDVEVHDTPENLLIKANAASQKLARKVLAHLAETGKLPEPNGLSWGGHKTTRQDFEVLCRLTPDMSEDEVARRLAATAFRDYSNAWLDIWGRRFVHAPSAPE